MRPFCLETKKVQPSVDDIPNRSSLDDTVDELSDCESRSTPPSLHAQVAKESTVLDYNWKDDKCVLRY